MYTSHCPAKTWRLQKQQIKLINKTGTIESFSLIHNGPDGNIKQKQYHVALINIPELEKKILIEICHENSKNIKIGKKVKLVYRKHQVSCKGLITYVVKGKIIE